MAIFSADNGTIRADTTKYTADATVLLEAISLVYIPIIGYYLQELEVSGIIEGYYTPSEN